MTFGAAGGRGGFSEDTRPRPERACIFGVLSATVTLACVGLALGLLLLPLLPVRLLKSPSLVGIDRMGAGGGAEMSAGCVNE